MMRTRVRKERRIASAVVARLILVVAAVGCLVASPISAQSRPRAPQGSCLGILSRALVRPREIVPSPISAELATSTWHVIDSIVPRSAFISVSLQGIGDASGDTSDVSPMDTLASRLEAIVQQQPDTLAARHDVATVLADVLRGSRRPTQLQTAVVGVVYNRMRLPPGPAEVVAGDLTLDMRARLDALNALKDAPVDSALVQALFLNLCQLGTWATTMPLPDSVPGAMSAAITEWGETLLTRIAQRLADDPERIRRLAPCKSFETCLPSASQSLLAWLRWWSQPPPGD